MAKGIRYGGMPLGWRKPEGVRKQRQIRAYDDEWELVKRFDKLVKNGEKAACIAALEALEAKTE
mgnify:CR=1 FL=1